MPPPRFGPPHETFVVRDFALEGGPVLAEARLAWSITGTPDATDPVLTASAFAQSRDDLAWLRAPGGPLARRGGWTIHTELLGNGRSSSPSTTAPPHDGPAFPAVSIRDNVRIQGLLLDDLGVGRVAAVIGASMGGMQAVEWAVTAPERIGRAVAIAGGARTGRHMALFLNALTEALTSDPAFAGGRYTAPPLDGLSRLSAAWAPWAVSPRFFAEGHDRDQPDMAADDLEGFLAKWRTRYHDRDANDLLSHLATWTAHDIGGGPGRGGFEAAAARATVPVHFLPIATDAYFDAGIIAAEAAVFPDATVAVIDSPSGHAAAFGRLAQDRERLGAAVARVLG
jgi:homoserine O-acetyltransferase